MGQDEKRRKIISTNTEWFYRSGASFDSDYAAILAAAQANGDTLPSNSLKTKQNTLVLTLKAIGVWTLIDILYVLRNNEATLGNYSLYNWKNPAVFKLTSSAFPVYTTTGYDGNGTTQFLSTNWTPSTDGVNYTQNSASMFGKQTENVASGGVLWGSSGAAGADSNRFIARNATDLWVYQVNCTTIDSGANTDATGFWQEKRTASNATALFKNGASVDTTANSVNNMAGSPVTLLAYNVNGTIGTFSPNTIECYGAGAAMTTQQSVDLYIAFDTYFNSL